MVALIVVLIIAAFMLLDVGIQYIQKPRAMAVLSAATSRIMHAADDLMSDFLLPLGYFFHPGHTWARIQESGDVLIGSDDFANKVLGNVERITLPEVGQQVRLNTPVFQLIQGGKRAAFMAPVSGTVLEVNAQLRDKPTLLRDNPYGSGWVLKVRPTSAADDLKGLLIAEPAKQWLKNEIRGFRDFLMEAAGRKSELGMTLADGGVPVSGVMEQFGEAEWNAFQDRFLNGSMA